MWNPAETGTLPVFPKELVAEKVIVLLMTIIDAYIVTDVEVL